MKMKEFGSGGGVPGTPLDPQMNSYGDILKINYFSNVLCLQRVFYNVSRFIFTFVRLDIYPRPGNK